jgi:LacI family transcriptional regulator
MPTIADVAKLAGVSTGTVSRVMNGAENVHPETRSKVTQAIATLGYEPNVQARSLRSKRTDTIALALPELANYFWTTVARGVQDASQAKGYHVLICNTNGRPSTYLRYLQQMVSRVDGMILSRRSERVVVAPNGAEQALDSGEKPVVFVGQSQAASWNVDNVYSDSISGAFALTEHLIRLGHRSIAIITGRQSSASASDRAAGFCMALADAGIPIDPQRICWGEYDRKTAERLTDDLIERLPDTTGIVAANNEIAIGVIQALEKRGLPVPKRVAVACFDDFYPDSRFATMMTVASQSPYDIGVNAAQLLMNRLNSSDYLRPQTVVLPARLIVRQSCGGVPSVIEANGSFDQVPGALIPSLPRNKVLALAETIRPFVQMAVPLDGAPLIPADRAQITLLQRALKGQSAEPVPHFEYAISSRALYRYVLEREPEYEVIQQKAYIAPEDQVEFAQRTGIAAIPCRFPYQPAEIALDGDGELPPFDFPLLTDQIDFFDRYLRAARNTNVGIAADFRSIVGDTQRIVEALNANGQADSLTQRVADDLLDYQSKVVQLICDRFADELAFVLFSDCWANESELHVAPPVFQTVFGGRLKRLIRPARERGLPTVLYASGKLEAVIPLARDVGFDALYIGQGEHDLPRLREVANGLSLMGGLPASSFGSGKALREQIALVAGGGYVAGAAGEIDDGVTIAQFFTLLGALSMGKG